MNRIRKELRRRTVRQAVLGIGVLGTGVLLCGCSIFPEEEEDRRVQYVESAAEVDYEEEVVTVDTITVDTTIHANYQQTKDEYLAFDVDDEMIREVFVSRGDEVQEGDVIAQLDVTAEETALTQLNHQIEKNEKQKQNLAEILAYDLQEAAVKQNAGWYEDDEAYAEAVNDLYSSYNDSIQSIDDSLYIEYMQQQDYEQTIADSYLYAGISGTVSNLTLGLEGTKTVAGENICRIIDTSEMYFIADTEYADRFEDGEEVTVTVGSDTYETVVSHDAEDPEALYLTLMNPDAVISYNAQGSVYLVLDEAVDVLTVSKSSVYTNGDTSYVYQIDENGIRKMTEVTTGISSKGRIEITSGLSAGDVIIKE